MPCRNSCRLYIHLAFHILRWSLKRSVKRTWTALSFPPMRVLEVYWSRALSLVCEVVLIQLPTLPLEYSLYVGIFRFFVLFSGAYSTDSLKMVGNFPEAFNSNHLFLKLDQFACHYTKKVT